MKTGTNLGTSQTNPKSAFLNSLGDTRNVVFFVGAGISVCAGYPLWKDASKAALEEAIARGLSPGAVAYGREKLAKAAFYDLFEILKTELIPAAYREITTKVFGGSNQAGDLHRLLARIPARGIITTNFDECLVSACVLERKSPPLYEMSYAMAADSFFVVKPHGTIQSPDSMVLATSDWKRVEANGTFKELLAQTVSNNQLVFLGYGLGDPDFSHIWDALLRERVFRAPALYCCQKESLPPNRIADLREKNVQVVEFQDDGSFEFLKEVLNGILERQAGVLGEESTTPRLGAQELERYVLLCLQFSPQQGPRLVLVCKAAILEILFKSQPNRVSPKTVFDRVEETLGQRSTILKDAARGALRELLEAKIVASDNDTIAFEPGAKSRVERQVTDAARAESVWVQRTLADQAAQLGKKAEQIERQAVADLLDQVLMAIGNEVAELFLFNRLPKGEIGRVEEIVAAYCEKNNQTDNIALYQKTLKRLLFDPAEGDEDLLFKRLQAYFITSAYVLNPTSERLLADYAREHWVYLDSSILLPALAVGHPAHGVYKSLLHSTRALGMKIKVLSDMLNEVQANVKSAQKAFLEFKKTGVELREVLEGSVALSGTGNGNVFLEGYLNQLRLDGSLTPEAYMSNILGPTGTKLDSQIASALAEMYGVEIDEIAPSELDTDELAYITNSIEHLRKMGGRFKTRLLCEHEARQFVIIHRRRKQHPELMTKIWFVTTDYFITELQRLEKERYPLPMSYTPRMWFQYLSVIDTEARGSKHFSRLQPTMRFGVITGDLGIEAIKTLLAEQKSLIEQGTVTVKELAEVAVKDFHIRQTIGEYDRASNSQQQNRFDNAKVRIRKEMSQAVKQFVGIRSQELDRLKDQAAVAQKEADQLRKKLAKSDHLVRILKRQVPPNKKKRRKK